MPVLAFAKNNMFVDFAGFVLVVNKAGMVRSSGTTTNGFEATRQEFDDAGRLIKTIENYQP